MRKVGFLIFYICFIISLISCRQQTIHNPNEFVNKPQDIAKIEDPYFTESISISSTFGPKSITRNILEDQKGNLWFATWEGIFKYESKAGTFTNYTNKYGLKRHRIFSLLEDSQGAIWFGTIGAGVYRYDQKKDDDQEPKFTRYSEEDGLVNNDIGCIYEDDKGNLWFGTRLGLSCLNFKDRDLEEMKFTNYTKDHGLIDNDINAIVQDDTGVFWIGTRGRACTFDGSGFSKLVNDSGAAFQNVRTIIKDKDNNIFLGGNDGLWHYDGEKFEQMSTDFTGYLYEDSKANIWASESEGGFSYEMSLNKYQFSKRPVRSFNREKIYKPEGQVFGINEDALGNIWFGTEKGVCKYDVTLKPKDVNAFECFGK